MFNSLAWRTCVRYNERVSEGADSYETQRAERERLDAERREAEAEAIDGELARVCGIINMAAARQVELIRRALDNGSYAASGVRSAEQWVAWKCGVSPGHARALVAAARRLPELPESAAAFAAGELSEDQVGVICRHAPAHNDAEVATLARSATVAQLRRVLSRYAFAPPAKPEADPEPESDPEPAEPRRVSFGYGDDGSWRLSALLAPDEGALVERALAASRQGLISDAEDQEDKNRVSWADAFVAMAERSLAAEVVARPHHDRHLVLVHVERDAHGPFGSLHLGPVLPDALRRQLACDARARIVLQDNGVPLSVGRTRRIVPDRTRVAVEHRDAGCRVPGCERRRWLQVHHIVHWEDGGRTDTPNLVALCSRHHRLHHQGMLGISGDADDPDGLEFTDHAGRRLTGCGRPAPPGELVLTATYAHPTGERLDGRWVQFRDPPGTPPPRVVTEEPPDVWRPRTEESFGWWIPWPEPATASADGDESWDADQDLTYA